MSRAVYALDAEGKAMAVPPRIVTGPEAVLTQIRCALITAEDTWLLDRSLGLWRWSWHEAVGPSALQVEAAVRRQLRKIPGVISVDSVTSARLGSALHVSIRCTVEAEDGRRVRAEVAPQAEGESSPGAWYRLLL